MNIIKEFLNHLGLELPFLVAGLMGAVTSLTYEKNLTFGRAVLLIMVGAVAAGYLSPLVSRQLSLSDNTSNMAAFVTGLLSMRIIGALLSLGDALKKDPSKLVKK